MQENFIPACFGMGREQVVLLFPWKSLYGSCWRDGLLLWGELEIGRCFVNQLGFFKLSHLRPAVVAKWG